MKVHSIKKNFKKTLLSSAILTLMISTVALNTGCDGVEGPMDFSQYDTNKDGRLSKEEFKKSGFSLTEFSRLDTDNDKHLSKKEFSFLKINF